MNQGLRAVVSGASRGIGRGVAEALGEIGATVYLTGRDAQALAEVETNVTQLGGKAIPLVCDHTNDAETEAAFGQILGEGPIDVLANCVWGGYEQMVENGSYTWELPFWEQPLWRFDSMFAAGVRAGYACSRLAAASMVERGSGLIVHLSHWSARKYIANAAYGAAKAATDRLVADTALELKAFGVTTVALYPGLVRTEKVMEAAEFLDLSNSESPRFTGRVIAALARDPDMARLSGGAHVVAALARDYDVRDVDDSQPRPLTLADA